MKLRYETRDGKGNDIIKEIPIKEFPVIEKEFICPNMQMYPDFFNWLKKRWGNVIY